MTEREREDIRRGGCEALEPRKKNTHTYTRRFLYRTTGFFECLYDATALVLLLFIEKIYISRIVKDHSSSAVYKLYIYKFALNSCSVAFKLNHNTIQTRDLKILHLRIYIKTRARDQQRRRSIYTKQRPTD